MAMSIFSKNDVPKSWASVPIAREVSEQSWIEAESGTLKDSNVLLALREQCIRPALGAPIGYGLVTLHGVLP